MLPLLPDQRFCGYCGARLTGAPPTARDDDREAALLAHAERQCAHVQPNRRQRVESRVPEGSIWRLLWRLLWSGIWTWAALGVEWVWGRAALAACALWAAWLAFETVRTWWSFARAPLERRAAVLRDERRHVSGGRHGTSTRYHLLLDFAGDGRHEFQVSGSLAGSVAPGDTGVAFVRAGVLLDFVPLRPPEA